MTVLQTKALKEILDDRQFRLDTAENVFLFLVALGAEESEEFRIAVVAPWFFFSIKDMPQIHSLVALFVEFFGKLRSVAADSEEGFDNVLSLLHRALRGATTWNQKFQRLAQLQALIIAEIYVLRKARVANAAG